MMKQEYNSALEMVIKIEELENQLKKCQDIAMALGIEHNEKNAVIAKQAEIIEKLESASMTTLRYIAHDRRGRVTIDSVWRANKQAIDDLAKYKGKE